MHGIPSLEGMWFSTWFPITERPWRLETLLGAALASRGPPGGGCVGSWPGPTLPESESPGPPPAGRRSHQWAVGTAEGGCCKCVA